jgi:type III secretory pathway component EscV
VTPTKEQEAKLLELARTLTEALNKADASVSAVVSVLMGIAASTLLSQVSNERERDMAHELMHNMVCKLFEAHEELAKFATKRVPANDKDAN